jgi:hypothetical protein
MREVIVWFAVLGCCSSVAAQQSTSPGLAHVADATENQISKIAYFYHKERVTNQPFQLRHFSAFPLTSEVGPDTSARMTTIGHKMLTFASYSWMVWWVCEG